MNELLSNGFVWYSVGATMIILVLLAERRGMVQRDVVDSVLDAVPKDYADRAVQGVVDALRTNNQKWDDILAHVIEGLKVQVWDDTTADDSDHTM